MLKIRSIVPVAALAILAACGGEEEAAVGEADAVAEPVPAAVVTEPVTPVPATTDPAMTAPATTDPAMTAPATGMPADTTTM